MKGTYTIARDVPMGQNFWFNVTPQKKTGGLLLRSAAGFIVVLEA
jgi:hypothetical protein